MRTTIEFRESLASLGGQAELMLPPVRRQRFAADQAVIVKLLHDAAEVTRIEVEFGPDFFGGRAVAVRQFIQHPRLAQRELTQKPLAEHTELARVKAVEGANRRYVVFMVWEHGAPQYLSLSIN